MKRAFKICAYTGIKRRKEGSEMSPSERQAAIWDIVYQQRYETVPNLAHTFGVSTRTIYTDLGKMKGKYLIDVIPGRYGGVYLALEPTNTFKYLRQYRTIHG